MSQEKENNIPNTDEFRKLYLDPRNISLRGKQFAEMQGQRREKLEKRNSMWNDNQAATSRFTAGGWTGTTLVFAILAAVYIKTMHPSLPGGDSGKFVAIFLNRLHVVYVTHSNLQHRPECIKNL